jgi:secreted PhoX family phosphatase
MSLSRRQFLRSASAVAVGFYGLKHCLLHEGFAQSNAAGYGELLPDPAGLFDLPRGFSYKIISKQGNTMADGLRVPGLADGMAAFAGEDGKTILVCNHEVMPDNHAAGAFGDKNEWLHKLDKSKFYDWGQGKTPGLGGTTTLVYDTKTQVLENQFLSLAGTERNCAGGPTPWGSWITCEETNRRATIDNGGTFECDHGYNFEVPATTRVGITDPVPLTGMGRFNHEAIAVDPRTGIVYQTEDRLDGLIYRYIPHSPGQLAKGGTLQAMVVHEKNGLDTRNWDFATNIAVGTRFDIDWMNMEDIQAPKDDLRMRGATAGAAVFARGEGMWYGRQEGQGVIYWACTNGGRAKLGQIWRYVPSANEGTAAEKNNPGHLELWVEPNDGAVVRNADNLTVAPWGDVIFSEDGPAPNGLAGITPQGRVYRLGKCAGSKSELAGVTFSPDGNTLFFNIYKDGLTLAVTGPWQKI